MKSMDYDGAGARPEPSFARDDLEHTEQQSDASTVITDQFLDGVVERFYGETDPLYEQVRRLRALRTRNEDARKRVLSPALVTTQNSTRIHALQALVLRHTEALRPMLEEVMRRLAILDIARQQLEVYREFEDKLEGERAGRDQRQLTPLTYEFIDILYTHYGVDGSALSALEADDIAAFAETVRKRHAAIVPDRYPDPC
jgi:uncharacterized Zn finger protein